MLRPGVLGGPITLKRRLTTASRPLALASDYYSPSKQARGGPVVILHGLYGSKQNWRSLAKGMSNRLERDVHALVRPLFILGLCGQQTLTSECQDLRNHGDSPHSPDASYLDLSGDVAAFIEDRQLKDVTVVGHSMYARPLRVREIVKSRLTRSTRRQGWKSRHVAGSAPHSYPHQARWFVAFAQAFGNGAEPFQFQVVDMAPGVGKISPEFGAYLKGMQEITEAKVFNRKEADAILTKYEPV